MSKEKNILDVLGFTGHEFGEAQVVDGMSMVAILGPGFGDRISDGSGVKCAGNSNYGHVELTNSGELPAIVPTGAGIITKRAAQDHVIPHPVIVEAEGITDVHTAACVEPTQGGMLRDGDEINRMLPLGLRAGLEPETKTEARYDKMWTALDAWGSSALREFFGKHGDELEAFAAEFEPMVGQIGAFVFFGNALVGFDVLPSADAWLQWWRMIIRDCYGAEYVRTRMRAPQIEWPSFAGDPDDTMVRYQEWLAKETAKKVAHTTAQVVLRGQAIKEHELTGPGEIRAHVEYSPSMIADIVTVDDKPVYVGAAIR